MKKKLSIKSYFDSRSQTLMVPRLFTGAFFHLLIKPETTQNRKNRC